MSVEVDVYPAEPITFQTVDGFPKGDPGKDGAPGPPGPEGPSASRVIVWGDYDVDDLKHSLVSGVIGAEHDRVPTIVGESLHVQSNETHTDNQRREIWLVDDRDLADADVTVRLEAPSEIGGPGGGMTPQPGLALRVRDYGDGTGALININFNIYGGFGPWNVGIWTWSTNEHGLESTRSLQQRTQGHWSTPVRRSQFRAAQRTSDPDRDFYYLDDPNMFLPGDQVVVSKAFPSKWEYEEPGTFEGMIFGGALVALPSSVEAFDTPGEQAFGVVTHVKGDYTVGVDTRYNFPCYVRARVVGNTLWCKSWVEGATHEPEWGFTMDLSDDPYLPKTGKVGLMTCHLANNAQAGGPNYVAFGPMSIDPISR